MGLWVIYEGITSPVHHKVQLAGPAGAPRFIRSLQIITIFEGLRVNPRGIDMIKRKEA